MDTFRERKLEGNGVTSNRLSNWSPESWRLAAGWLLLLQRFLDGPTGHALATFIRHRLALGACIYPSQPLRALALTPLADVRMVILGQDPYHGEGQADGLAFSVPLGVREPPSLRNIWAERQRDLNIPTPAQATLEPWARQGVLLLNTVLTVEHGQPVSHAQQGWEVFTDAILAAVAQRPTPCVYLLWGAHAQAKAALIQNAVATAHADALVLQANHPSPLSARRAPRPFIGCGHFSKALAWLAQRGFKLSL